MHLNKKIFISFMLIMIFCLSSVLLSREVRESSGSKRLDIFHYHNVGNIWLRISNYGFFGSGDDVVPQYPSLEYPGGTGIDYLYQGALWFGAKKYRRNQLDSLLYYQTPEQSLDEIGTKPTEFGIVVDTLVSVGFDGDDDMYEFLPAYNELESSALGTQYDQFNLKDKVATASIRDQKTGVDDDGDGFIDEDPVGFQFPFRSTVPTEFSKFKSNDNQFHGSIDSTIVDPASQILNNSGIWFPFGFLNLGYNDPDSLYNFSQAQDDDGDGLQDEDGYPTSEQDYIGYYYDYSPFGTPGERVWGDHWSAQEHKPFNVRVRQASFQWSYEYIKNLVYIEFDITNMNRRDTLYDCAMGIYMDSDVGPQAWGVEKASDDISSYVTGAGYNFAYTYDADTDGGLTTGYVGCRVCTPDPDQLEFACWTWEVGDGPQDGVPNETRNEKYWLMTHNDEPFDDKYTSLKAHPQTQMNDPCDTRFLFSFYGAQPSDTAYSNPKKRWDLAQGETMKIVAAVFPGATVEELKRTSVWAKTVYKEAQTLTNVVKPDTFIHYQAPGPPDIPNMYLQNKSGGESLEVYWDNRSEFTIDKLTIQEEFVGWQEDLDFYPSYNDSITTNLNATLNPEIAYRLRHDFQGYTLWKAANSGEKDAFMRVDRWDKIDTQQDLRDYNSCMGDTVPQNYKIDYGGDLGVDTGLPNKEIITEENDILYVREESNDPIRWTDYYRLNDMYRETRIEIGDTVHGVMPIYAADVDTSVDAHNISAGNGHTVEENEALLFKNPNIPDDLYLALYDDGLIPLGPDLGNCPNSHGGQTHGGFDSFEAMRKNRLARVYYNETLMYPERGVENYIAVTTFDRGIPSQNLGPLESGRDADANMKTVFPGPNADASMDNIYVVPNPYIGQSKFDGRREGDVKGDRSKRLWFVNIPEECTINIFTLAGDLVDKIEHDGETSVDVINPSKASQAGIAPAGMHGWDLLSRNNQIIAPGVYIYSVKNNETEKVKLGKFVIIK